MDMIQEQLKTPNVFTELPFPQFIFRSEMNPLVYSKGKKGFVTELDKLESFRRIMSNSEDQVVILGDNVPERHTVAEREQSLFHFNLHLVMAWLIHPSHVKTIQDQWEWMIVHLDQCLIVNPVLSRLSNIMFWKGYFLYQLKRYSEAIFIFEQCLKDEEPFKIKELTRQKYRHMYDAGHFISLAHGLELFLSLSMLQQQHALKQPLEMTSELEKAIEHLNHYIDCAPSHSEFRVLGVAHMIIMKHMYPQIEKTMLELAHILDDDLLTVEAWSDRDWRSMTKVSKAMDIVNPLYPLMECDMICAFNGCDRFIKKEGQWMMAMGPQEPIKVTKIKSMVSGWDLEEEEEEEQAEVVMEPLTVNDLMLIACPSCGLVKYCSENCMLVEQSLESAHDCNVFQQRQVLLQKWSVITNYIQRSRRSCLRTSPTFGC
jgi:tetratricopeptide (TPR) repeat protein